MPTVTKSQCESPIDPADGNLSREETAGESSAAIETQTVGEANRYGAIGGFVSTVSMTVFRMPTSKSLPPTAEFWATFVGSKEPESYPVIALVLHLLYGVVNGILFAFLSPGRDDADEIAETKGAVLGTVFGIVLSIFGTQVVLDRVLQTNPDRDERLVFHISHVVYALTLGTWVGSRVGDER